MTELQDCLALAKLCDCAVSDLSFTNGHTGVEEICYRIYSPRTAPGISARYTTVHDRSLETWKSAIERMIRGG